MKLDSATNGINTGILICGSILIQKPARSIGTPLGTMDGIKKILIIGVTKNLNMDTMALTRIETYSKLL